MTPDSSTNDTERPEEIKNVLRAEYEFTDEPLDITGIDGIYKAIEEVAETQEVAIVECEDHISDYKVYWNSKTETVRIGAYAVCASYEVPKKYTDRSADTKTGQNRGHDGGEVTSDD